MKRRLALIVAASALPFLSAVTTRGKETKESEKCCVECNNCQKACLECVADCLEKNGRKDCIQACLDCADICEACSKIDARQGPTSKIIAEACAAACENCAKECDKHKDDASCMACAKECRKCGSQCRADQ